MQNNPFSITFLYQVTNHRHINFSIILIEMLKILNDLYLQFNLKKSHRN